MTDTSTAYSCVALRFSVVVIVTSLFAMTSSMSLATTLADEGNPSECCIISVVYELPENAPEGAILGCLRDHQLTLGNFRCAEGKHHPAFAVNPTDGSIIVVHPDLLNAEAQPELRLSILADEELAARDDFRDDFLAGLLEEDMSMESLKTLSVQTVVIEITVRLREVPKRPELEDADSLVQVLDETAPVTSTAETTRIRTSEPVSDSESALCKSRTAGSGVLPFEIPFEIPLEFFRNLKNPAPENLAESVPRNSEESVDQPVSTSMETTANNSTVTAESSTGLLLPVVVAITFVFVCAAVAIVWFRATVRRGILEEAAEADTARSAELIAAPVASTEEQNEGRKSDQSIALVVSDFCSEDSDLSTFDAQPPGVIPEFEQLSECVRHLQEQLANRDAKIERLTSKLAEVCQAFDRTPPFDDVPDAQGDEGSCNRQESQTATDELTADSSADQPQREQVAEPLTEARSSLTIAREQLDRQMRQHLMDPDAIAEQLAAGPIAFATPPERSATPPETCDVAVLEECDLIRSEFSDLFEMQDPTNGESAAIEQSALGTAEENLACEAKRANDEHADSVNHYLTNLLERSRDAASSEAILVNRRKENDTYRGSDRRANSESPRKPVVSFLDSYMQAHGGELAGAAGSPLVAVEVERPEAPPTPILPRKPIDVASIRASMTSFRAVAIQYVDDAVSTYNVRQAKGKVAVRSMWISIVFVVSAVVILTNIVQAIQFSTLSWLLLTGVALSIAELCLRMQQIQKQRKITTSVVPQLVATKRPGPVLQTDDAHDDQIISTLVAGPASSRVSPRTAAEHPQMAN